MTIADAFNEITENLGGTPNYSGTIASAIDALNDTLAGSDQDAAQTIEGAVRLLGQHIGGGGGGTEYGSAVNIFPRLDGETYYAEEAHVLSEVGNAVIGNIMGDLFWFDDGKNYASYGNVNVGIMTPDNYTATLKVNDGDPQPVSKFFNEDWEMYTYAFTVPNVTQEDYVYLDFAE